MFKKVGLNSSSWVINLSSADEYFMPILTLYSVPYKCSITCPITEIAKYGSNIVPTGFIGDIVFNGFELEKW